MDLREQKIKLLERVIETSKENLESINRDKECLHQNITSLSEQVKIYKSRYGDTAEENQLLKSSNIDFMNRLKNFEYNILEYLELFTSTVRHKLFENEERFRHFAALIIKLQVIKFPNFSSESQ